jgi:hypothetical protein
MPIIHAKQSAVGAPSNGALVGGPNWNANHVITLVSVAVTASGAVANTTEVEEVTTGASALARTLPSAAANPGMVIRLIKVDGGAGSVTYTDSAGANIGGSASYQLNNEGQYVVLQASNLTSNWNIIGGN